MPVETDRFDVHGIRFSEINGAGERPAAHPEDCAKRDDFEEDRNQVMAEEVSQAGAADAMHFEHFEDARDNLDERETDRGTDKKEVEQCHAKIGRSAVTVGGLKRANMHEAKQENTDGNVRAVGAGERVECGAKNAVRDRHVVDVYELTELEYLATEEDTTEEHRPEKHVTHALDLTALNGVYGERHEERRHKEDERRKGRQLDVENLGRLGIARRRIETINKMGRNQRAKEHAVRSEKSPPKEFFVRNARAGSWVVVNIDSAGGGVAAHG